MIKKFILRIKIKVKRRRFKKTLSKGIKGKQEVIIRTSCEDRCIGKTTILADFSKKYDIPVLVKYEHQEHLLKRMGVEKVIHIYNLNRMRGARYTEGCLVEEGFTEYELSFIKNLTTVYGYQYIKLKQNQ